MSNNPMFIVGAPRSGTTLLSSMLANHSRIACGPETQFFSYIKAYELRKAVKDRFWPQKAVTLLSSLELSGQMVHKLFDVSRNELLQYLSDNEPSIKTMLESLTALFARKKRKPRWAEKTPNHLLHLPEIRELYPEATIIRIIRDPRDSAISMRKLPWTSESILANCYLWDEWFQRSHGFFKNDKNSITVRYEDLIKKPEKTLQIICNHIRESFEQEMLNTAISGKDVMSPAEPWKAQVTKPLDMSRGFIWKNDLPQHLRDAASHICYTGIMEFNYEPTSKPEHTVWAFQINRTFIEQNESLLTNAAAQKINIAALHNNTLSSIREVDFVLCSVPDFESSRWFLRRLSEAICFILQLILRRLNGRSNKYIPECINFSQDYIAQLCTVAIKLFGEKSLILSDNTVLEHYMN